MLGLVIFLLAVTWAESRMSGLYRDDGLGQTVFQEAMSPRHKREIEAELLAILGLEERPPPADSLNSAAREFLLEVYSLLDPEEPVERQRYPREFRLTGPDLRAIRASDTILTLVLKDIATDNARQERGKRLWFNLEEISGSYDLVGTGLRLYQSAECLLLPKQVYTVTVYTLDDEQGGEKTMEYVDSANTTCGHEGWLTFNMTWPLTLWMANRKTTAGLYLSLHLAQDLTKELLLHDIGLMTSTSAEGREPFLVVFLNNAEKRPLLQGTSYTNSNTLKRSTKRRKARECFSVKVPESDEETCRIHRLFVTFKELGWEDWVIAPTGMDATYCSGKCQSPLSAMTSHVIIQKHLHLIYPNLVPETSCAPQNLSSRFLLINNGEYAVLKKYHNMVATSCGCH